MIDNYCERLDPGFWAEPLNALTNLAFLIAAVAAWRLAVRHNVLTTDIIVLIGLIAAVGIGSGAFHTFATYWAMLMDVIPILLLQITYLWIYGRRIVALKPMQLQPLVGLFVVSIFIAGQFPHLLNGSLGYLPALVALLIIGIYHLGHAHVEPKLLLIASTVFLVSLTLRTIDNAICDYLTIGTHFFWHLFNGLLLYLIARGLIMNLPTHQTLAGTGKT